MERPVEDKIAILEDEPDIRALMRTALEKEGFRVYEYGTASEFFSGIEKSDPSLLILDIMLPDYDGFEVCRRLRSHSRWANLPIIMVSARGEEMDRVLGLELGADDYVVKPFSPRELVARVKANLRRARRRERESLKVGDIEIFPKRAEVYLKGKPVNLTFTEFQIILALAKNPGRVFSRSQLIDIIWKGEKIVLERTIDVHIKKLREKLGELGGMIKSVRGMGYKIEG